MKKLLNHWNKAGAILLGLAIIAATLCSGCLSTNFTEFAKAMENNDSTLAIKINTVYGTASFIRVGGGTNSTVTASPDGTVSKKTN